MFISKEEVKRIRTDLKECFPDFKFSIRRTMRATLSVRVLSGTVDFTHIYEMRSGHKITIVDEFCIDEARFPNEGNFESMNQRGKEKLLAMLVVIKSGEFYKERFYIEFSVDLGYHENRVAIEEKKERFLKREEAKIKAEHDEIKSSGSLDFLTASVA